MMWKISNPLLRKTNQGNLLIRNLDQSFDWRSLYDIFSTFGSVLRVKIPKDERGVSKGFGFVQFESKESADKARHELNGLLFNNKQVYIEEFVPRKNRTLSDPEKTFTNLYVKHLPRDINQEEFTSLFSKYGEIVSAAIRTNPEGGECFGYGYVCFKNHEAARDVIHILNDWEVFSPDRVSNPLFFQRFMSKNEREAMRKKQKGSLDRTRCNLFIKNLDEKVNNERLREAFKEFGEITAAKIMKTVEGISNGFGFVSFSTPEAAKAASHKMFGSMLEGKPISVSNVLTSEQCNQELYHQLSKPSGAYDKSRFLHPGFPHNSHFVPPTAVLHPFPERTTHNRGSSSSSAPPMAPRPGTLSAFPCPYPGPTHPSAKKSSPLNIVPPCKVLEEEQILDDETAADLEAMEYLSDQFSEPDWDPVEEAEEFFALEADPEALEEHSDLSS